VGLIEAGGAVKQETRLWHVELGETLGMRSKEEAHDYRYFPCPDLLPLEIEQAWVDQIAATMPELPDAKKARFMGDFGLTDYDANVLTADLESAGFFEAVAQGRDGKTAANWVINELFGRLNKEGRAIADSPVSAGQLGGMLDLLAKGEITGKMAKDLFEILWTEGGDPAEQAAKHGMKAVTDTGAIEKALDDLIAANPDQVEKAKVNAKLAGWFTGQVLKATGGKANPAVVNAMVAQKLGL
jgi:aspartyl-tRNA(Asn)/glutamyl-tRNA(Gln) amidotransferase subunit B